MRVYKLSFRTPGVFLDREGNNFKGNLEFEVEKNGEWVSAQEAGLQVISSSHFSDNIVLQTLPVTELDVPTRDEGIKVYYLLIQDNDSWNFRLVATECPDCWDFFNEIDPSKILEPNRTGKIIVGEGTIPAEDTRPV